MIFSRSLRARLAKLEQRVPADRTMIVIVRHFAGDDHGPDQPAGTLISEKVVMLERERDGPWREAGARPPHEEK